MLKKYITALLLSIFTMIDTCKADDTGVVLSDMYTVYEMVEQFCGGISDHISKVSGVSKANTAVTAVGTAVAGGALATGLAKQQTDNEIHDLSQKICEMGGCDPDAIEAMSDEEFFEKILPLLVEAITLENQDKLNQMKELRTQIKKSKQLGDWRTGLLAGTVGTNVVSAIISGLNRNQSDLIQQISACNMAVNRLRDSYNAAIAAGINPAEEPVMQTFKNTMNNCGTLQTSEVEKIEKRMTAVMGTSIAGVAIGTVGTGTSIAANTDKIRNDNSEAGKQKEKNLNTVSNIAAGANIATGAVETGLNISLISLTKKLIHSAELCEETLL